MKHRSSSQESTGGGHNIYTYDPQGNKVYLRTEGKDQDYQDSDREDDSTYGTNTSSPSPERRGSGRDGGYVTIDGEPADDKKVPPWLKYDDFLFCFSTLRGDKVSMLTIHTHTNT